MSLASARHFLLQVEQDKTFRVALQECSRAQDIAGRLEYLQNHGFSFSASELAEARSRLCGPGPWRLAGIVDRVMCDVLFAPQSISSGQTFLK